MRKFLVKNFVLDYFFHLFGKRYNAVRASRIIVPLFLLTGLTIIFFSPDWPTPSILLWVLYFLDILALFFGFVYFKIKPAKWEELDTLQKLQGGYFMKLTSKQLVEWANIVKKHSKR